MKLGVRQTAVGADVIDYRLHRVRRRTIGLHIDAHGLTVRAPHWAALRDIEAAIAESQRWIETKQIQWRTWREQQKCVVSRLADGGEVQYLGEPVRLRLVDPEAVAMDFDADTARDAEIRIAIPSTAAGAVTETTVREALQSCLQAAAQRVFAQRLSHFAGRMPARFASWRLSSARTLWGSCSHDGRIRLNWRLVHFSFPVIDYVIAHELAHLHELNHGPRFWAAVGQLLPGYEAARDQIKRVDIGAISF